MFIIDSIPYTSIASDFQYTFPSPKSISRQQVRVSSYVIYMIHITHRFISKTTIQPLLIASRYSRRRSSLSSSRYPPSLDLLQYRVRTPSFSSIFCISFMLIFDEIDVFWCISLYLVCGFLIIDNLQQLMIWVFSTCLI